MGRLLEIVIQRHRIFLWEEWVSRGRRVKWPIKRLMRHYVVEGSRAKNYNFILFYVYPVFNNHMHRALHHDHTHNSAHTHMHDMKGVTLHTARHVREAHKYKRFLLKPHTHLWCFLLLLLSMWDTHRRAGRVGAVTKVKLTNHFATCDRCPKTAVAVDSTHSAK